MAGIAQNVRGMLSAHPVAARALKVCCVSDGGAAAHSGGSLGQGLRSGVQHPHHRGGNSGGGLPAAHRHGGAGGGHPPPPGHALLCILQEQPAPIGGPLKVKSSEMLESLPSTMQ